MRITNKIMQNNSLYNINNNKVTEDQLNTMMSTGKKITRPSDDPVIAIRALRLRSNVTQLSQYYEKNAKDAESWINVTADALSTITAVLTDCVKQATKGASKDLTIDDLSTIVTQMDSLAKEYYAISEKAVAKQYLARVLMTSEDDELKINTRNILGKIYIDEGNLDAAKKEFDAILEKNANFADAHYGLGILYEKQGDNAKARAEWRKCLKLQVKHAGALQKLSEIK